MKTIKYIFFTVLFLLIGITQVISQQEQHFSQFMYNRLAYNIGYSGSDTKGKINLVHRNQWISIDGAPSSQLIGFNTSFMKEKVGAGINLRRQSIGISTQWTLDLAYAYRMKIKKSTLGLGMGVSIRYFGKNYGDSRIHSTESRFFDNSIPEGYQDKTVGNINLGIYFESKSFYFGLSIPRFLDRNISLVTSQGETALEVRHYYFIGGGKIKILDNIYIEPNILLKYVELLPLDSYFNTNLNIDDNFFIGITYHTGWRIGNVKGNAIGANFAVNVNKNWKLQIAYDYELSDIRRYTSGSLELGMGFTFGNKKEEEILKMDLY